MQKLCSGIVHPKCGSVACILFVALSTVAAADENEKRTDASGGEWITFLSHRSGDNLLYKMRPDGAELAPIFGGGLEDVPGLSGGMKRGLPTRSRLLGRDCPETGGQSLVVTERAHRAQR